MAILARYLGSTERNITVAESAEYPTVRKAPKPVYVRSFLKLRSLRTGRGLQRVGKGIAAQGCQQHQEGT
jgi:hypothetical protein